MTHSLLTDKEVAAELGIARTTIWAWVAKGTFPRPLKIGGMSRWPASDVDCVIATAVAEREAS